MNHKNHSLLKMIFAHLERGDEKAFWQYVSEDVTWIVEGTHPLAGRYTSLIEFKKATFDRLQQVLAQPIKFRVRDILVEGQKGVVVMDGEAISKEGIPFHNRYCWIVNLSLHGKIDRVDAFLDTQAIADLFSVPVKVAASRRG